MGTKGFLGIRRNGQNHITYSHFDSYPDALGFDVMDAVDALLIDRPSFQRKADDLKPVSGSPTAQDIKHLEPWTDLSVSKQSTADWYCLLRGTQGDLAAILDAGCYMDVSDQPLDSLRCKWGYLVNLDDDVIEVFRGFQKEKHDKGRFASSEPTKEGYYPVALIGTIPFTDIAADVEAARVALLEMCDQEDEEAA